MNKILHSNKCANHDMTVFSPFFLFFGRHPVLSVNIMLPNKRVDEEKKSKVSYTAYVTELKKRMEEAYHFASQTISKSAKRCKSNYNSRNPYMVQQS